MDSNMTVAGSVIPNQQKLAFSDSIHFDSYSKQYKYSKTGEKESTSDNNNVEFITINTISGQVFLISIILN